MPDPGSEERIRELEERMAAMPGSRIFATLADEYRRAGLHEAALHILQTGLVGHPTYLSAQIALARLYQEMGRTESAVEAYEKVLATDRENLVAAKGLAEIHQSRGELLEAVKRWKLYRALSGDRDIDARIQYLESMVHAKIPDEPPREEPPHLAISFDETPLEPPIPEAGASPPDREFETLFHAPSLNRESLDDVFPIEESPRTREDERDGNEEFSADFSPPPAPTESPNLPPIGERETEEGPGAQLFDVEKTEPMRLSQYVSGPAAEESSREEEPTAEVPFSPADIPPSRTLADLYLEQGYHDDARKMYERLAAADPLDESVNLKLDRLRRENDPPPIAPDVSTEQRHRAAKISMLDAWLSRVRAASERGRGSHV